MDSAQAKITAIYDCWPSIAALARDLGVKYETVQSWKRRGRLPPAERDLDLIAAAGRRGIHLTIAQLAVIRSASRRG